MSPSCRLRECVAFVCLAVWLAACALAGPPAEAAPSLRIGVGGMFPCGLEGIAARLGLPRERIYQAELADSAALKRYDVVLITSPPSGYPGFIQAFKQYIESGGRGLIEMWRLDKDSLLPTPIVGIKGPQKLEIVDTSTSISRGYDLGSVLDLYALGSYTVAERLPGEQVIARYKAAGPPQGDGKPALVLFKMGQGELLFAGPPLGFSTSSRGPALERLAANAIEYLCGDKADPRFVLSQARTVSGQRDRPEKPGKPEEVPPTVAEPPAGTRELDAPASDEYDVVVDVQLSSEATGQQPAEILFDYLSPKHHAVLRIGSEGCALLTVGRKERQLWHGPWPTSAERWTAILKRRRRHLELATAAQVVARVPYGGGKVDRAYLRPAGQGVRLSNAVCQPLGQPLLTDDFMRQEDKSNPWEPKSGSWQYVGLDSADYSVNGFTYLGRGTPALAVAGDWFWEDYVCTVGVQPLDAAASVGLAVNYQEPGNLVLFRLTVDGQAEIVHVLGAEEEVLAATDAGLAPKQWYRPGLRVADGTVEAFVDGEPMLECQDPSAGCGAIGLWVSGGRASFDDVEVLPVALAGSKRLHPAKCEGTANATLPVNVGALDGQTWASRAVPWLAQPERPSLLWHKGAYFGDVRVRLRLSRDIERSQQASLILAPARQADRGWRLTARRQPQSSRVQLELRRRGKALGRKAVRLPQDGRGEVELARRGRRIVARWRGRTVLAGEGGRGEESVGLELVGPPIHPADLVIESPNVRDYTFAAAPTDWWAVAGDWGVAARWACDERWSWLCLQSDAVAAVWNKHRFAGDLVLDYYMAVRHKGPGGDEAQRSRDLNAALCGDGKDPNSGYSFVLGGDDGVVTSILKRGEVVAQEPKVRVPIGYSVHHQWHHIQVGKVGDTLSLSLENRPVLTWTDPDPIEEGYVGVWTRRSAVMLPRVTIYFEREVGRHLLGLPGAPA